MPRGPTRRPTAINSRNLKEASAEVFGVISESDLNKDDVVNLVTACDIAWGVANKRSMPVMGDVM